MASDTARRGRPRGSGLDDRAELSRIAELLEADPTLKPTTAIKAIGVSDPSSIRRLRDKLKTLPPQAPRRRPGPEPRPAQRQAGPSGPQGQSAGCDAAPATAAGCAAAQPAEASRTEAWLAHWCAVGLHAVSSALEAQIMAMNDLLSVPQVESALRQQLLFNEVAKAFCPKRPDVRATLH